MQSDIEIARAARLKPIAEIAAKIGAPESALYPFGRFIAKLEYDFLHSLGDRPDGKLILVTAINPTPAGEGKTTTTDRPRRRAEPHRQEDDHLSARAFARAVLRPEGRRDGRRLRAGRPDGRDQPPFHRRFSRHNVGAQSPRGDDRQSHVLGQCARPRPAAHRLAARPRHERPGAARDRDRARRRQRVYARGRFRHHGRLRGDGGLLPRVRPRRSRGAARPDGGRPRAGTDARSLRPTSRRRAR